MYIAGRPHGTYFTRMALFEDGTGRFLGQTAYGEFMDWSFLGLETGAQDKGPTQVFNPNPVNTLNNHCLWDQNNARAAVPSGAYEVVELTNLNPPPLEDGFYRLSGPYVSIEEISPPNVAPPLMPGPSYAYFRDEAGFEATMAYYHINKNQEYIQSLGMPYAICDRQVSVDAFGDVEGYPPGSISAYRPSPPGFGYIRFGYQVVDHAEDADVIVHEYGHAVLDNMAPGVFGIDGVVDEDLMMAEGFANYWAASSTSDQSIAHGFPPEYLGEWYVKSNPGCQPLFKQYGNVDNHFTKDSMIWPYDKYREGQLWSGALWDLLQALGKPVADRIILDGHDAAWNKTNPTFDSVAQLIYESDGWMYGGAHKTTIAQIFRARGLCDCPCHGDPVCDGVWNVLDVVKVVDVAFRGYPPVFDPLCSIEHTDLNCDGFSTVFDVVNMVNVVFRGSPPAQNICDPCAL